MTCPSVIADGAFLSSMLEYVDCQAQLLGENGYRALADPTSSLSPLLTLALTVFVALLGYRFLIGDPPRGREAAMAAVKVGIVLMLATSWTSFRTLAYDVTMTGPAELAQSIGEPSGLPGTGGGLNGRLQRIDDSMAELLVRGTGQPFGPGAAFAAPTGSSAWVPFDPEANREMLSYSRSIFLTATIASFASVRLVAGLLLALGPIFVLFLLFTTTRGLFEGWLRGLIGAIVGAAAVAIILAVQLALMEPWLANILAARRADVPTPAIPVELFVATLVFGLVLLAALIAAIKIAGSLRFPEHHSYAVLASGQWRSEQQPAPAAMRGVSEAYPRSRSDRVADAIITTQNREDRGAQSGSIPARSRQVASQMGTAAQRTIRNRNQLQDRRRTVRQNRQSQQRDMG